MWKAGILIDSSKQSEWEYKYIIVPQKVREESDYYTVWETLDTNRVINLDPSQVVDCDIFNDMKHLSLTYNENAEKKYALSFRDQTKNKP